MKCIIVLLLIGCAFGDDVWDELVDQAIDAARGDIIGKHFDLIKIPDLDNEFHETVFGIPFSVEAKIKGAEFWNVSTVSRRAPVDVFQDDATGNITLSTALGLDDFYLNCKDIHLKVFGLAVSGSLSTHCGSNALEFSISLITDEKNKCNAYINWARITNFNDFNVEIKPSAVVNWLAQHIASLVLNDFSSKVTAFINKDLTAFLNSIASKIDVCSYIPLL